MECISQKSIDKNNELIFPVFRPASCSPDILVAGAEVIPVNFINFMIDMQGLTCHNSSNKNEAELYLSRKTYDIVFLDLGLPDGASFGIMENIVHNSPQTLIIVLAADNDIDLVIQLIGKGIYDYIRKPFTVDLSQRCLERVMEEWERRVLNQFYRDYLERIVENVINELSQGTYRIEHIYEESVLTIGSALDLGYPETEDHFYRVSENSVRLGEKLGLTESRLSDIRWGAYLHDIGQVCISDAILLREKSLTQEEMAVVKGHPMQGCNMIRNIDIFSEASKLILHHHERYDGTGYPHGLRGENIPLAARIFAVIDTFDALTVERPYREAQPFSIVAEEIKKHTGTQFDPEIVEGFLEVPVTDWMI